MAVLNLSLFFLTYASRFQTAFRTLVRTKTGIDGRKYDALKNPRKGRSKNSRLNDTGKFRDHYVIVTPEEMSLTITPNTETYSEGVSYADIINYNNRDSGLTNIFISKEPNPHTPPLIYPNNVADFQKKELKRLMDKFEIDMIKAVEIQLGQTIPKQKIYEIRVL
jgi:hypothetical protein